MSQNPLEHSVVHEYSVLYSDRILQKDKKWNDGKLRFYELNGKLEVSNSNDNIIASDFFASKSNSQIQHNYLRVDNQFKLPNRSLLIEILEIGPVYERDISKSFPKKSPKPLKINENIPMALLKIDPNSLNLSTTRRRRIGLTRSTKSQSIPPSLPVSIPVPVPITSKKSYTPIKQNNVLKSINKQKSTSNDRIKNLFKRYEQINALTLPRIPPSSNKRLQFLQQDLVTPNSDPIPNMEVRIKVKEESIPIISTTTVEEADLIYDLSDLEEDDKFHEMIIKLRRQREEEELKKLESEASTEEYPPLTN
ncbi:uncharacterized protein RJT21DRAFT_118797 [Scheffersomyces amazonensis]|uniref:uncharacterized protein n=1 Tax=Scheffersomyces amazonensis TaxID=1078765 RepID=UPI00315D851E